MGGAPCRFRHQPSSQCIQVGCAWQGAQADLPAGSCPGVWPCALQPCPAASRRPDRRPGSRRWRRGRGRPSSGDSASQTTLLVGAGRPVVATGGGWVGGALCRFRHRPSSQFMHHPPRVAGAMLGALLARCRCRGGRRSKPLSPPTPVSIVCAHCRRRHVRRCQCGLQGAVCCGLRDGLRLRLGAFHVQPVMHLRPRVAPSSA